MPWETFEHQADLGLDVRAATGAGLFAAAGLARRHGLRSIVKAATYHGVSVRHDASGWRGRVILDV